MVFNFIYTQGGISQGVKLHKRNDKWDYLIANFYVISIFHNYSCCEQSIFYVAPVLNNVSLSLPTASSLRVGPNKILSSNKKIGFIETFFSKLTIVLFPCLDLRY